VLGFVSAGRGKTVKASWKAFLRTPAGKALTSKVQPLLPTLRAVTTETQIEELYREVDRFLRQQRGKRNNAPVKGLAVPLHFGVGAKPSTMHQLEPLVLNWVQWAVASPTQSEPDQDESEKGFVKWLERRSRRNPNRHMRI